MMADYWLDHGMSRATDRWPNLPFPYNTDVHSGRYDGDMRAGKGYLQPDKAGSFGAELVMLYKMTGNPRYLDAAVKIADSLAAKVSPRRCRSFSVAVQGERHHGGNRHRQAIQGILHFQLEPNAASV